MRPVHFITFANTAFMQPTRILEQAKAFPFASIRSYSELDFPAFFKKHAWFINRFKKGYGFYIWKPHVIYERLKQMKEGEVLLYMDAGCHLNASPNALKRFHEYSDWLSEKDAVVFSLNDSYKATTFIKQDAIDCYYPELNDLDENYIAGSVILVKKSQQTMEMIYDWLTLCKQYCFIDTAPSRYSGEAPWYSANDFDNALYAVVVLKHLDRCKRVYPDELNLYNAEGTQSTQLPGKETLDWSPLDASPFQTRRDRPG